MSPVSVRCPGAVAVRYLEPRDLPEVLRIAEDVPAPQYSREDFYRDLGSSDLSAWIAEADNQVVGFVVCRVQPQLGGAVRMDLLHLAVAAGQRRRGVARSLLKRFEDRLGSGNRIQATVPEASLDVQMFLRSAGYKAVRVLRGHFDGADAYVMERR
jgi:[ribosomal protein S18]-alanine N-acetyltransferase